MTRWAFLQSSCRRFARRIGARKFVVTEANRARGGRIEATDDIEDGRLTRPGWSQEIDEQRLAATRSQQVNE